MRAGKRLLAGIGLSGCLTLMGCVTMGRPIDRVARTDIPLVPVPPPPLGRPETPPAAINPVRPDVPPAPPMVPIPPPSRPATSTPPAAPAAVVRLTARQLVDNAQKRYAGIDSYIVRLTRREMVNGRMNPEEVILVRFRKEPWSVYLKWLGKEGKGREVVYVKGRHESKIHTLLASGDIPFVPAGKRMALAPDSVLVRSATRHPITEAGIGASIERLAAMVTATERGDGRQGSLTLLGPAKRDEFDQPVQALRHTLPAGLDPSLPKGGQRTYYFDPETGLPMLICTVDERGQDAEYYRYCWLQPSVKLDDADFDPEQLWGKARAAAGR
jgi:hypothetical protein